MAKTILDNPFTEGMIKAITEGETKKAKIEVCKYFLEGTKSTSPEVLARYIDDFIIDTDNKFYSWIFKVPLK